MKQLRKANATGNLYYRLGMSAAIFLLFVGIAGAIAFLPLLFIPGTSELPMLYAGFIISLLVGGFWFFHLQKKVKVGKNISYRRFRGLSELQKDEFQSEIKGMRNHQTRFGENRFYYYSHGFLQFIDYSEIIRVFSRIDYAKASAPRELLTKSEESGRVQAAWKFKGKPFNLTLEQQNTVALGRWDMSATQTVICIRDGSEIAVDTKEKMQAVFQEFMQRVPQADFGYPDNLAE